MNVMTAIQSRREIVNFKSDSLSDAQLNELVNALYLSPSGNNIPSREFIQITDRSMLRTLSSTTPYMKWLEQAAAGIVIIGKPELSKYWLQDASIAGGFAWLAAVSMGLGAAWGAVHHSEDEEESSRREHYVKESLNIPDEYRVVAILGFGYPAEEPTPKKSYPLEQVLHKESFGRQ